MSGRKKVWKQHSLGILLSSLLDLFSELSLQSHAALAFVLLMDLLPPGLQTSLQLPMLRLSALLLVLSLLMLPGLCVMQLLLLSLAVSSPLW